MNTFCGKAESTAYVDANKEVKLIESNINGAFSGQL
jgi:hypothetical protein